MGNMMQEEDEEDEGDDEAGWRVVQGGIQCIWAQKELLEEVNNVMLEERDNMMVKQVGNVMHAFLG